MIECLMSVYSSAVCHLSLLRMDLFCTCLMKHSGLPTSVLYCTPYYCTAGKMDELELYKEFRAKGEPSPLLRIAEHWLRAEMKVLRDGEGTVEEADGDGARSLRDPTQTANASGGGFAPGRMAAFDFIG